MCVYIYIYTYIYISISIPIYTHINNTSTSTTTTTNNIIDNRGHRLRQVHGLAGLEARQVRDSDGPRPDLYSIV